MKIIPAIDLMDGKVVRLTKGDPEKKTVYSNNPIKIAKKWEDAGADMLHVVDLDATLGHGSNFQIIKEISDQISIPIQIAGGLRDIDMISNGLKFANRAVIGTLAMELTDSEESERISLLEEFDKNTIIIREHPAILNNLKFEVLIKDIIEEIIEYGNEFVLSERLDNICSNMACHSSIRAGRSLQAREMNALLREMENTPNSSQCNHGRPTFIKLSLKDIENLLEQVI